MDFTKSAVNWGSVPDWIAGIGSLLAFVGFAYGLWWEIHHRRKSEEQEVRRQARRVYATIGVISSGAGPGEKWAVTVTNDSTDPIFDVDVTGHWSVSGRLVYSTPSGKLDRVDPQHPGKVPLRASDGVTPNDPAAERLVSIEFTDFEGRRWRRWRRDDPESVGSHHE